MPVAKVDGFRMRRYSVSSYQLEAKLLPSPGSNTSLHVNIGLNTDACFGEFPHAQQADVSVARCRINGLIWNEQGAHTTSTKGLLLFGTDFLAAAKLSASLEFQA